jgi:hypothetical protein
MQHYTTQELAAASLIGEWLLPLGIMLMLIALLCFDCG